MTYKFTRVYEVEAKAETEAFRKCQQSPAIYLTFSSVAVEPSDDRGSWRSAVKKQVIGR